MFRSFLLATFQLWFWLAFAGGLALLVTSMALRSGNDAVRGAGRVSRWLVLLAIAWNVAMGLLLALAAASTPGVAAILILPLCLPVLIAIIPLTRTHSNGLVLACAACAIVLSAFSFITGFSIGAAYPPSAVLLVVAGCVELVTRLTGPVRDTVRRTATVR